MSTKSQIEQDIITAMKAKEQTKLNALRFLKNAIQLVEKNDLAELDEDGVQKVVAKQVKDRKESIKMFEQGGRNDLVQKETEELNIIEQYLPPQMSYADIESIVTDAITSLGATSMQDKGKVMGYCMNQLQGNADGTVVNEIVTKLLSD